MTEYASIVAAFTIPAAIVGFVWILVWQQNEREKRDHIEKMKGMK